MDDLKEALLESIGLTTLIINRVKLQETSLEKVLPLLQAGDELLTYVCQHNLYPDLAELLESKLNEIRRRVTI